MNLKLFCRTHAMHFVHNSWVCTDAVWLEVDNVQPTHLSCSAHCNINLSCLESSLCHIHDHLIDSFSVDLVDSLPIAYLQRKLSAFYLYGGFPAEWEGSCYVPYRDSRRPLFSKLARASLPTSGWSNLTRTTSTWPSANVTSFICPHAPFARPSPTSMLYVSMTLAPTAASNTFRSPPVSDAFVGSLTSRRLVVLSLVVSSAWHGNTTAAVF